MNSPYFFVLDPATGKQIWEYGVRFPVQQIKGPGATSLPAASGHFTQAGSALVPIILSPPRPGGYGVGDDGIVIAFTSLNMQANTIKTATNGINGDSSLATGSGSSGDFLMLIANNGTWCVISNSNYNIT